jgi:hypothetical protein
MVTVENYVQISTVFGAESVYDACQLRMVSLQFILRYIHK